MLAEFALDPELLGNWKDFRFFVSQFGAAHGRLISRFPKQWKGMVKAAAQNAQSVEFLRIVEALERLNNVMMIRYYDYNKGYEWLRNAADENGKRPFHAIVATKAHGNTQNLIIGSDLDPTDPPDLWVVPTSVHIQRVAADMASCVEPLLSQCDEVLFVDPYYGPGKKEHNEPLAEFLDAIASRGQRRWPTRIEYHTNNRDQDISTFRGNLAKWVKPKLPPGVTLTVVRWNPEEMHNRYILTERGGAMFGHGLDQDRSNPPGFDTVSLLDDNTCAELIDNYSPHSQKLTWLADTHPVTG